jgi:mannosyltransferase
MARRQVDRGSRSRRGRLRRPAAALVGIVLAGAALRFSTLDVQSFWLDEAFTATLLKKDLGGLLGALPDSESTPPLYYVLAWLWSKPFGTGEVGLRSLSALLGTATIPIAYAAARELLTERVALVAAALVAVNPYLVWFSQEARAYSLFALLGAVSFLYFARAWRDRSGRALWLWAAASAAMIATHYFGAFLVAAEAAALLARLRDRPRAVAAACVPWLAVGGALVPLALAQRGTAHTAWIDDTALATRVRDLGKHFLNGPFGTPWDLAAVATAALALASLVLLATRADDRERRGALLAAGIGVAVVGSALLFAIAGADYFFDRNLIVALVPLLLVPAAGFAATRVGLALAAAFAAVLIAFVIDGNADRELRREDWRHVAVMLRSDPRPQAVVISFSGLKPIQLYMPELRPFGGFEHVREVATIDSWRFGFKRPRTPGPPAPGLTQAERVDGPTYTVIRYSAPRPVGVSAAALVPIGLDDKGDTHLLLNP